MKIELKSTFFKGNKYFFIDLGKEDHGRPSFRIWINRKLVNINKQNKNGEHIEFPIKNAKIIKTEKGNYVLRPEIGWNTYIIFVNCGYRGSSNIKILDPKDSFIIRKFEVWESPRGKLGISTGFIISTTYGKVTYKWEKTGRTYGKPKNGIKIIHLDSKEENLDFVTDGEDTIKELETLTI